MYFNFTIYNFTKQKTFWYKLKSFHRQISTHKHLEIESFFANYNLILFEFDCRLTGKDHGGVRLKLNICCVEVEFHLYDSRHWDYTNNCWETKITNN